jgi:hypothetical protein
LNPLGKFLLLPPSERRLLLGTAAALALTRLGLALFPYDSVRRGLGRLGAGTPKAERRPPPERLIWAVRAAGRYVPNAEGCLPQALVAGALLNRWGYPAELRMGMARDDRGRLHGHAWVESGGRVVVGGSGSGFTRLPRLERGPA